MNGFRFAEPQLIHVLWLVALIIAGLFWLERRGGQALGRFVSEGLQGRLVTRPTRLRRGLRLALLGFAAVCLVLALMRPQWGREFIRTARVGAEIMICLDVSRSMLAEDVAPNRLERAKIEIRDLLTYLDGDQVGLIAFAGRASVVSPLTPDFSFLRLVLDGLNVGSVGLGGTRLEEPIRKAVAGFGEAGDASRVILLITDGEDHGSFPVDAAEEAARNGVTILTIGFGDEAGSEIRVTDPETGARVLLRGADGAVVRSRLDGDTLRKIALTTNGAYIPAGTGVLDLESIFEAHIAPLMRGRLDSHGRTVQQEGYQWAVLLGLLALLGSLATNARAASLGIAFVLLLPLAPPSGAQAAVPPAAARGPLPGAAEPAGDTEPAGDEEPVATETAALEQLEIPADAREAYNRGLEALEGKRLDDSERLLEAARSSAGSDGEVRFRASYNLGFVAVVQADAQMQSAPESALAALERAADWFGEAIALREGSEEARRNLEIVMQRALVLSDSLAERSERDLAERLEQLIETQRAALGAIREVVDLVAGSDDPDAVSGLRRVFRMAAVEERKVLSEAAVLAKFAGDELASLEEVPEEERSPEDGMRVAQLSALLHYLHRARERIGQARSQLRQRQAEHGFRRAAAGLSSFKRARDQLRDPVQVLDSILVDAAQLSVETRVLARSWQNLALSSEQDGEIPEAPEWLSARYLEQAQEDLAGRAGELQARLRAGLSSLEPSPSGEPTQDLLLESIRQAEPLVAQGHDKMLEAYAQLKQEEVAQAILSQADATLSLARARERFLDLKGLIELAYTDQRRIAAILDPEAETTPQPLAEYLAALTRLQGSNLSRMERLLPLIDAEESKGAAQAPAEEDPEAVAQQRQRFESARGMVRFVSGEMEVARGGLVALIDSADSLETTQESVAQAARGLAHLRRLFFSIVEHLRDTAERQVELADETESAVALAEAEPEETLRRVGPLVPRQRQLAEVAEQIALGLHEQAHSEPPPGGANGAAPSEQQVLEAKQRLTEAAELVLAGQESMVEAGDAMEATPPSYAPAREQQTLALEKLAQALALLNPQPPPDQERGEQQQAGGEDEQAEEQPQEQAGAADPSQLLQSVRDREAQRHRDRSERTQRGYEPVEKDW